jgi:hypothetical protein
MTSPFVAAAQAAAASAAQVMGETIRLTPMLGGRYKGSSADNARNAVELVAIVRQIPHNRPMKMSDNVAGASFDHKLVTATHLTIIAQSALGANVFRKDDQLIRLDLPGQPTCDIVSIETDGPDQLRVTLAALNG